MPVLFLALALKCWITQEAGIAGRGSVSFAGWKAIAMGFAWAGASVYSFFHFGITPKSRFYNVQNYGRGAGVLLFAISLLYVLYHLFVD